MGLNYMVPKWMAGLFQQLDEQLPANTIVLYEHTTFNEGGRIRRINVTESQPVLLYSLHVMDFKDCLSSLKWNLDDGVVVTFFEHHTGGRQYQISGSGQDKQTKDNNFKDFASSWAWHRSHQ